MSSNNNNLIIVDGIKIAIAKPVSIEEEQSGPIFKKMGTWSSTSHVGSDYFNAYRRSRENEMIRLSKMDEEEAEQKSSELFQKRRLERAAAAEARTTKNAMKRKRKKLSKDKRATEENDMIEDESESEKNVQIAESKPRDVDPFSDHLYTPISSTVEEADGVIL